MKKVIIFTVLFFLMSLHYVLYAEGLSFCPDEKLIRTVKTKSVGGTVYVYATFDMGPVNPVEYKDGLLIWRPGSVVKTEVIESGEIRADSKIMTEHKQSQKTDAKKSPVLQAISLGEQKDGKFTPAVRFGLGNDNRVAGGKIRVTPWATDGTIDYFGMHARPDTPYDFKIKLDLKNKQTTVFVSGRGDDDWFLMAENMPLINAVGVINHVQIQQYPNGPEIRDLKVLDSIWAAGEKVRPHRLAKQDRTIKTNEGFKFQSMRSTWSKPGRHVTVARKQDYHMAFPDVVQASDGHLVCVWSTFSHTGGGKNLKLISHSYDLGKTWTKMADSPGGGRIQKLKDGSLLLEGRGGYFSSTDDGKTWTKAFYFELKDFYSDSVKAGAGIAGHIAELPDGSWLHPNSHWPGGEAFQVADGKGEQLVFYHSTDRGKSWQFWSELQIYPPHSICEPTLIVMPDNKLMLFARESRNNGFPGIKAFSSDNGKTWQVQELPFPVMGRTWAKFLSDGRVMLTTRSQVGKCSLWAWVGDPYDKTPFKAAGIHFNDRNSVGLKNDALHIDSDGMCGQYTCYLLRPADSMKSKIDFTAEVKVLHNDGYAATLGVPFVGKVRLFPDRVEFAHDPSVKAQVTPGKFHTYRVVRDGDIARVYVDDKMVIETDKCDRRTRRNGFTPATMSAVNLSFGNEMHNVDPRHDLSTVYTRDIPREVTGYSIWRRVEVILDDPTTQRRVISWLPKRDGFPDQYQLDNIIEVDASIAGSDQGYSGWVELKDGKIFVVNYTDDTAGASKPDYSNLGVPWIRGTFLELSDLPPFKEEKKQ